MPQEIWLADLIHKQHRYFRVMPLGIGHVASYAQGLFGDNYLFRFFKNPDNLAAETFKSKPLIAGFTNSTATLRLSYDMAVRLKKCHPETIIVMGGPNFSYLPGEQSKFLKNHPLVDIYICGDGEVPFSKLLAHLETIGFNVHELKQSKVQLDGCCYLSDGQLIAGDLPPRPDIEDIPSPYLNGMLDQFFDEGMAPLVQFTRGCPFTCTYCVEGTPYYTRIRRSSLERLEAELRYIGDRTDRTELNLADANFGMFKNDIEAAEVIAKIQEIKGWPKRVYAFGGKNRKDTVLETYRQLKHGTFRYTTSLQTTSQTVLENIRRNNISVSALMDMAQIAKNLDWGSNTELITGLPGDTREVHLETIRTVIDAGIRHITIYPLAVTAGSELDSPGNRQKFQMQTRFSIFWDYLGYYQFNSEKFPSAEIVEMVVGSSSLTFEDYLHCHLFDLSVSLFYNDGYFSEIERLLQTLNLPVFDFLKTCHDLVLEDANSVLGQVYADIKEYIKDTTWETEEEAEEFIAGEGNLAEYMKIEYKHNYDIVRNLVFMTGARELHSIAEKALIAQLNKAGLLNDALQIYVDEIIRFSLCRRDDPFNTDAVFEDEFQFDCAELYQRDFKANPLEFQRPGKQKLRFTHSSQLAEEIKKIPTDKTGAEVLLSKPLGYYYRAFQVM